ncbi:DUF3299 domain-containing protein [Neptunicella marina]|uniref:DUF3299 domain-containing protein n=1 Tax=Neptunicella marina TaxID=2125989 RepID=A0A8J6IUL8_9ALTE|nr:DUF3299 domain-containing protein [Neptunicella marina]MBC3766077.1 DUF3299 domain-containing protein [Neptunicella marina]
MKKLIILLFAFIPLLSWADTKEVFWEDLVPKNYVAPEQQVNHSGGGTSGQVGENSPVVTEYNGETVKVPGFIVPLEGDQNSLTEFLLVPYFGACIHVPPPPSNQIVHVKFAKGIKVDSLYEPVWIQGVLSTDGWKGDIATVGYTMQGATVEPYEG